jgi:hypothetical protein
MLPTQPFRIVKGACVLALACALLSSCDSGRAQTAPRATTTTISAATFRYCLRAKALVDAWEVTKKQSSSSRGMLAASPKMAAAYRNLAVVSPAVERDASARLARAWEYTADQLRRLPPSRSKREFENDLKKITASLNAKYGSSADAADTISAYMKKTCDLELD